MIPVCKDCDSRSGVFCSQRLVNFKDEKVWNVDVDDMTRTYCAAKNRKVIERNGQYFITTLGDNYALQQSHSWTYENQVLCSNELWVLQEELKKLTKQDNEPEQMRLFI